MTKRAPGGRPSRNAKRPAGRSRRPVRTRPARSTTARRRPPRRRTTRPHKRIRLGSTSFRFWSAFVLIAFALTVYTGRLVQLQGVDENDYAAMALQKGEQTVAIEAPRAPIYDRNGTQLARTVDAAKLVADPTFTDRFATQIATRLHQRLGLDYLDMVAKLKKPDTRYVELARHLQRGKAEAVVSALRKADLPGVYVDDDTMRVYPSGKTAANIIGFVGSGGEGLAGLEHSLNDVLAGKNGSATYEMADGKQLPLAAHTVVEPKEGTGVRLTIDQDLQFLAQHRLRKAVEDSGGLSGSAVVMDVRSGEVLAMADYPTYNPNDFGKYDPDTYGSAALQDAYEPGSVSKVLTFSALLDAGFVTPRTKIVVPPAYDAGSDVVHDYWPHGTIHLTATGVVAKSSNIGTDVASSKMSSKRLYHYLKEFGVGSRPDIKLDGVSSGILPKPKTWTPIKRANVAFGQGISTTALQMTAAVAAVANGGVYVEPSLIEGYVSADGNFDRAPAPKKHRVVSEHAAHMMAKMMEAVVGPDGTAPAAAIKGYNVAGKTGTAQRVNEKCHCYDGTFTVSFAGFAPADNPRFAVYVVVQRPTNGGGGGSIGGPVFHDLMSAALQKFGVPPSGKHDTPPPMTW